MKIKFFKNFILLVVVLVCGLYFSPTTTYGIAYCSTLPEPRIEVDINGATYTDSATVTVQQGDTVSFTVRTIADPSSYNEIAYPGSGGKITYPGPSRSGRSYTTSPIDGGEIISAYIQQNCEDDGGSNALDYSIDIVFDILPPTCSISSFTADDTTPPYNTSTSLTFSLSGSFPWSISLLQGGTSPSPTTGTNSGDTADTGNLTATQVYRLTCGSDTMDLPVTPGPAVCVPDGSCSASAPACESTTTGVDNCGNSCSKT